MKVQLFAGGKRSKVTAEEATEMVKRWRRETEDADGVVKIDISCRSWQMEAFEVIQPFLEEIAKDVRYLNVADIIASLMTDEGLAVTERLARTFESSDLMEIDLSDNAMGPRGLSRVESMFLNSNLQCLYLGNCGLSAESMEYLKNYVLADDQRIARGLTDLLLDRNMVGPEGAKHVGDILVHCRSLKYFSYLGCRTRLEGTIHLARGLEGMVKDAPSVLSKLEMDDCTFGGDDNEDPAYVPLAAALKKSPLLQYLNISDGNFQVEGIQQVVDAIIESRATLTHLLLDGCGEMGTEGAEVLAKLLAFQSKSLICFKFSFNELGDEGVPILLEPFCSPRTLLEELHLESNEIEEKGAEAIVRAQFPKLKKLNLADNFDLPVPHLKKKYGSIVVLEEEEDEDEAEEAGEADDMTSLIQQFEQHSLAA